MTQRGRGEGTVYRDNKRNRWESQFTYQDPQSGETKRKKFTGKTRREALEKGRQWMQGLHNGLLPDASKITVGQWVDRWLDDFVKPSVRIKTYEKYISCVKNYIKPRLGELPLAKLNAPDVQRLWNELRKTGGEKGAGISALTVRNTRRYFIAALDKAVQIGYLGKNVARLTDPPKVQRQLIRPLNGEQAFRLLEVAREQDGGDVYVATYIALSTGMRISEVMGLTWADIDYENKVIVVRRGRVNSNHGTLTGDTKTSSTRKIPVHNGLLKALKVHQRRQQWRKDKLGDKYLNEGWVIGGQLGNNYDPAYFSSRKFKPLLKKAGIDWDFSFHDLRHTHATLLLISGIHPKIVQERLGHATIQMTLDTYSHLLPDTQEKAVNAIAVSLGDPE